VSPSPLPGFLLSVGAVGVFSGPAAIAGPGQPPLPGFPALREPWPPRVPRRLSVPGPEPPMSPPLSGCTALSLPGPPSLRPPPASFPSLLLPRWPLLGPEPRRCHCRCGDAALAVAVDRAAAAVPAAVISVAVAATAVASAPFGSNRCCRRRSLDSQRCSGGASRR
jgi:hypothetical protein